MFVAIDDLTFGKYIVLQDEHDWDGLCLVNGIVWHDLKMGGFEAEVFCEYLENERSQRGLRCTR